MGRRSRDEELVQLALCDYVRLKYPKVIFRSDGGGLSLPMGLAIKFKNMQSGRAYPDFFVAETNHKYCGLFIEIKKNRGEIYLKSGDISKSKHTQEQLAVLKRLTSQGYRALFGCGIDECIAIVDEYLATR